MYRFSFLIFLLFLGQTTQSQNLVPNGGFETNTGCPSTSCQWNLVNSWFNVNGTPGCNNGNSGSPDYFNTCGSGFFQFPSTLNGNLMPYVGDGVMGISTYLSFSNDFREYITAPLNTPLQSGSTYTLSFAFTNGASSSSSPAPSYGGTGTEIGIHFSVGALAQTGNNPIQLTPTIETNGVVYSTTWLPLSFTFTATGNYTHITIGNFRNDVNTTITQVATASNALFPYAYYYFDEVSVTLDNVLELTENSDPFLTEPSTEWQLFQANDQLTLQHPFSSPQWAKMDLVDVNGRILKSFSGEINTELVWNLSMLSQGAYFVRFRSQTERQNKTIVLR